MALEFTCEVTQQDVYAANKRLFRKKWTPLGIFLSWALFFVLFLWVRVIPNPDHADDLCGCPNLIFEYKVAAIFSTGWWVAVIALSWLGLRKQSAKLYEQAGTTGLPTTYKLTQERFLCHFAEGTSDHPWSRFCDWLDADTVLLLRRMPGLIFVIPKRFLSPQQLDDLIALLDEVGMKRK